MRRLTFKETGYPERAYSYLTPTNLPIGEWEMNAAPDSLIGEIETLAQSDFCPLFLHSPSSGLVIQVETS